MKTQYQLVQDTIEWLKYDADKYSGIEADLEKEEYKQDICERCPENDNCFSCGCWEWWLE